METPRQSLRKSSFVEHFSTVPDPRKEGMCEHLLLDILLIAVLAVICGADGWDEIHDWGVAKEELLRKMLVLPNGIPSADTFRRTFARINPTRFEQAFRAWIGEVIGAAARRHIAIDGKTSRGVARYSAKEHGLHLVHASL